MGPHKPISKVAIIGGGPTGIAFAKFLLAEKVFEKIDIFEQRDGIGGIWNISSNEQTLRIPIPQLDPAYGAYSDDSLEFESPMYDYLETNIPKQLMRYAEMPFPEEFPLFPSHQEVLRYLQDYAADVKHLIQFETQVQDVKLLSATGRGQSTWRITSKNMKSGQVQSNTYDAVVVASGHYTVPQTPDVEGFARWNAAYPGIIMHSKAYRKPEAFRDQKVLVVGNSASGLDISAQISPYSKSIYLSAKSKSIFEPDGVTWRNDIDEIAEFLNPDEHHRAIKTKAGTIVTDLDAVILATGYFFSYPFFSPADLPVITDGLRTRDTYKHFIHIDHPEIAFPVINMKIIPFGLAENQAAVIARLWSGRLEIPSTEEMRQWEEHEINLKGSGKHFHVQTFPGDGKQMNELYAWAQSARKGSNLDNEGNGKLGMAWDEEMVWIRFNFAKIRAGYNGKGDKKRTIKNLGDLDLDFAHWRKYATSQDTEMFLEAGCHSESKLN